MPALVSFSSPFPEVCFISGIPLFVLLLGAVALRKSPAALEWGVVAVLSSITLFLSLWFIASRESWGDHNHFLRVSLGTLGSLVAVLIWLEYVRRKDRRRPRPLARRMITVGVACLLVVAVVAVTTLAVPPYAPKRFYYQIQLAYNATDSARVVVPAPILTEEEINVLVLTNLRRTNGTVSWSVIRTEFGLGLDVHAQGPAVLNSTGFVDDDQASRWSLSTLHEHQELTRPYAIRPAIRVHVNATPPGLVFISVRASWSEFCLGFRADFEAWVGEGWSTIPGSEGGYVC